MLVKEKLLERFLRYVKIDTQSDEFSESVPSTEKQKHFAHELASELKTLGLFDVSVSDKAYVMATLPANKKGKIPRVGFIAHMDTSPDMSGTAVKPKLISNYDGKDIILNTEKNIVLSSSDFPELSKYKGQTLITTDGTTLLGADDKAGIAEIITAVEYLVNHPEIKHGDVKIAFTPDEEIGRGADHFDVKKFSADFAYTMDGGEIGELEYENFNAALCTITIGGRNVHPGTAKNRMINSQYIAMEFNRKLPSADRPEHTEGYQGFFHLIDMKGEVENTRLRYLIRDHSRSKFESRKELMREIAASMNRELKNDWIKLDFKDQYYNMKEKVEPVIHIVKYAENAMRKIGIQPIIKPIRGGTDGSRLSYMELPCPNIFTGGHNYHAKYEFIPLESMEKAMNVIIGIIKELAER